MAKAKPQRKQQKLTDARKKALVGALIRSPAAYAAVHKTFKENQLADEDRPYAAILGVARKFFDKHGKLPPYPVYESSLSGQSFDVDVFAGEIDDALSVVRDAFGSKFLAGGLTDPSYVDYAVELCDQWRAEAISWHLQGALTDPNALPENMIELLEDSKKALEPTLVDSDFAVPFPANWSKKPGLVLRSTGHTVFDNFLRGGDAGGEVYGVLGPFGSWKTLNATQLVGEAVNQAAAYVKKPDWDGRWPYAVLATYEAQVESDVGLGEMRIRLLAYLATVSKNVLEDCTDIETDLSRSHNLKEYETVMYANALNAGTYVPGEFERVAMATRMMNNHLFIVDMTKAGRGWVPEVEKQMSSFLRSRRNKRPNPFFNMFYLDYASLMCKRHAQAEGLDRYAVTDFINRTPDAIRAAIALPFNVPCWLNNQLSGDANSRGPMARISHADAGGCKSWGENLDFSFILHKPSEEGLGRLECDKHRRAPPKSEAIVRVDGEFSRVKDVSDYYDIIGGRFIEKEAVQTLAAPKQNGKGRREVNYGNNFA